MPVIRSDQQPSAFLRWRVGTNASYDRYHLVPYDEVRPICGRDERMDRGAQWAPRRDRREERRVPRSYWDWDIYCRACATTAQSILRGEATDVSSVPPEREAERSSDSPRPVYWMGEELPEGTHWLDNGRVGINNAYSLGLTDGSTYELSARTGSELDRSFAECVRQAEGVPVDALAGRTRAELLAEFVRTAHLRVQLNNAARAYTTRVAGSGYYGMGSWTLDDSSSS